MSKKTLCEIFNERFADVDDYVFSESKILSTLNNALQEFEFEGVSATEAVFDENFGGENHPGIIVTFDDDDGGYQEIIFTFDEENKQPIALFGFDEEDEEIEYIELKSLKPTIIETSNGKVLDLSDPSWIKKDFLDSIFDEEEVEEIVGEEPEHEEKMIDAYGHILEARPVYVVRGGKKKKLKVVRKKKRKVLSGKQRTSFRKAARKRKIKMRRTVRKRKRSLRIRKRLRIKRPKLGRFQKVQGTRNARKF